MKRIYTFFLIAIGALASFGNVAAQGVGINTETLDPSAVLQIDAPNNDKGIIAPRMSTEQKNAIGTDITRPEGLVVFDTDLKMYTYWNGSTWQSVRSTAQLAPQDYIIEQFINPVGADGTWLVPTGSDVTTQTPINGGILLRSSATIDAAATSDGITILVPGQYAITTSAVFTNTSTSSSNQCVLAKILTLVNGVEQVDAFYHLPVSGSGKPVSFNQSYVVLNLEANDKITLMFQKLIPTSGGISSTTDPNNMKGAFSNVTVEVDRLPYDCNTPESINSRN